MAHTMKSSVFMLICSMCLSGSSECVTWNDTNTLYNDLMSNYNKDLRPILNQSNPVTVNISFVLGSILEVDEVVGSIALTGAFSYFWTDENMVWNSSLYGGAAAVSVEYNKVWVPEIVSTVPVEAAEAFAKQFQKVKYQPLGVGILVQVGVYKSSCPINVENYPFDTQMCVLELYASGYEGSEIELAPITNGMDLTYYQLSHEWDLIETNAKTLEFKSRMLFSMKIKRKPAFAVINVVLPISFLGLLNVLVFLLVPESGERVSYCITVLLSISVFMTITSDTLPKSSEPVPLISYKLMIDEVISMLIAFVTILNLRLHNKDDDQDVTPALKTLYQFVYCKKCARNKIRVDDKLFIITKRAPNVEYVSDNIKQNEGDEKDREIYETCSKETKEGSNEKVTWKNIAAMVDVVFLIVFTCAVIASFLVFISLTYSKK